jgi:hypothetical protein
MQTALQGYDDNLAFLEHNNKAFLVLTQMSIAVPQEIYWSPAMAILTPRCGEREVTSAPAKTFTSGSLT